ncbi:MAG: DUF45 domain-containing protein [Methylococcaceae bacterium]
MRLNFDLTKKPAECLEYIVMPEMPHLLESTHNNRFMSLMDQYAESLKPPLKKNPLCGSPC